MINARCQFSDAARQRGIKLSRFWSGEMRKYVGKVVGESKDGTCWLVVWDRMRYPRQIEKVLIEREGAPNEG